MNPYVGKICPYCKTEIQENDDIVVCSKCEMPHHKDCWVENNGCTTFGCDGTIQCVPDTPIDSLVGNANADVEIELQGEIVSLEENYCPKCGSARLKGDLFCGHCGYSFITSQTKVTIESKQGLENQKDKAEFSLNNEKAIKDKGEIEVTDGAHTYDEYYENNTEYYSYNQNLIEHGDKAQFNWSAFLFDTRWMAYRKMYGKAALFSFIALITAFFGIWGRIASFVLKLVVGFIANKMYYNKISECRIEESRLSEYERDKYFNKHKGTSVLGLILYFVLLYGFYYLIGSLFGSNS